MLLDWDTLRYYGEIPQGIQSERPPQGIQSERPPREYIAIQSERPGGTHMRHITN